MDSEPKVIVLTRLDPEHRDEAQQVANILYDGNLSLLVRMAIKDYTAKHRKLAKNEIDRTKGITDVGR